MSSTLSVSEIFCSLQGEGLLLGVVSSFVRLAGCSAGCPWCDTPHAQERRRGVPMTAAEILTDLARHETRHVVVTGGEPLEAEGLGALLAALAEQAYHVTVETAGRSYQPLACDLVSMSPKLAHAHPDRPPPQIVTRRAVLQQYMDNHDYQFKFVVAAPEHVDEADSLVAGLRRLDRQRVMLMPLAATKHEYRRVAPLVAQWCLERGYRFCPRLQVELWGRRRGR